VIAKRLVAFVVAVGLIGISLLVRSTVIDNGDGAASGSDDGPWRLTCVDELADVCTAIADASDGAVRVTVEPAGTTAARLVAAADTAAAGTDGWLTLSPWPGIVAEQRRVANRAPVLGDASGAIARSPLVIAALRERVGVLQGACDDDVDWACIGAHAGEPWAAIGGDDGWRDVRPAHAQPIDNANGLLVLGQAAGHFLASPRLPVQDIATIDFDKDGFRPWFQQLESEVPREALTAGADVFVPWQRVNGVNFSAVGGLETQITRARFEKAEVLYPEPLATADVVFAPVVNGNDALAEIVTGSDAKAALARAAWRVPGQPLAPGLTARELPDRNNLPRAGTLYQLQQLWQRVVPSQ
jgi:hypothetical protein